MKCPNLDVCVCVCWMKQLWMAVLDIKSNRLLYSNIHFHMHTILKFSFSDNILNSIYFFQKKKVLKIIPLFRDLIYRIYRIL